MNAALASRHGLTRQARDITGVQLGRLTAIEPAGKSPDGHVTWRFSCSCGGETVTVGNAFLQSLVRSCGCLRRDAGRVKRAAWNKGKTYAIAPASGERVYRQSHAWGRALIRERGNRCELCGWDKARCDAHHRVPKYRGGQNTLSNGIVVCPNHHRELHESGRRAARR